MAKVQTRKSVSMSKQAFAALQLFAGERGYSCSALVEHAVAALIAGTLEPPVKRLAEEVLPKTVPLTEDELARRRLDAFERAAVAPPRRDRPAMLSGPVERKQACGACGLQGHNRSSCRGLAREQRAMGASR